MISPHIHAQKSRKGCTGSLVERQLRKGGNSTAFIHLAKRLPITIFCCFLRLGSKGREVAVSLPNARLNLTYNRGVAATPKFSLRVSYNNRQLSLFPYPTYTRCLGRGGRIHAHGASDFPIDSSHDMSTHGVPGG